MRKKTRSSGGGYEPTGGGNVLFTLGLISVVVLLVVGFVMTQGNLGTLAARGNNNTYRIAIDPTPKPVTQNTSIISKPDSSSITVTALQEELKLERQKRIEAEQKAAQLQKNFDAQINNMQIKLLNLEDELKRLREK